MIKARQLILVSFLSSLLIVNPLLYAQGERAPAESSKAQVVSVHFKTKDGKQGPKVDVISVAPGVSMAELVAKAHEFAKTSGLKADKIPIVTLVEGAKEKTETRKISNALAIQTGSKLQFEFEPTAELKSLIALPEPGTDPYEIKAKNRQSRARWTITLVRMAAIGGAAGVAFFQIAKFPVPAAIACTIFAIAFTGGLQLFNGPIKNLMNKYANSRFAGKLRSAKDYAKMFLINSRNAVWPAAVEGGMIAAYMVAMQGIKKIFGMGTNIFSWRTVKASATSVFAEIAVQLVDAQIKRREFVDNYIRNYDRGELRLEGSVKSLMKSDLRVITNAIFVTFFQMLTLAPNANVAAIGDSFLIGIGVVGGTYLVANGTNWLERLKIAPVARKIGLAKLLKISTNALDKPVAKVAGACARTMAK